MQACVALDRPLPPCGAAPTAASRDWDCARYLAALHPAAGRGKVSFLARQCDAMVAHTRSRDMASVAAKVLLESKAAYVAMNPYYGPRGGRRRLASLNALFVDLDVHRVPALAGLSRAAIAGQITARVAALDLPPASVIIDSGRGFYAVWLLDGGHPAAEPRWRAATRALVGLFAGFGADPACVDPARVLRLPESWHDGAARAVAVIAGDGARHGFDALCDRIFVAAGRPTREALSSRRAGGTTAPKQAPHAATTRGPGLPRRAFWAAVQRDLDRLRTFWGGTIPVGRRDLWLHAHACALAWTDPDADIAEAVAALAADAAPGLSPREAKTSAGTVARRARDALAGRRGASGADPRYSYAGATLAERLDIDAELAARLGLEQLVPDDLRAARRARARTARRRAAGALPRALWLAQNPLSREEPWLAEGVSRATWYRRLKEQRGRRVRARLADLRAGAAALGGRETGAVWLYEGEATPGTVEHDASGGGIPSSPRNPAIRRASPPNRRPNRRPTGATDPADASRAASGERPTDPPPTHSAAPVPPVQLPTVPYPPLPADPKDTAMPSMLDPAALAAAAARLDPADLAPLAGIAAAPEAERATILERLAP